MVSASSRSGTGSIGEVSWEEVGKAAMEAWARGRAEGATG
jgi:hypothetical protein